MKCPKCNRELPDRTLKFCPACGQKLDSGVQKAKPAASVKKSVAEKPAANAKQPTTTRAVEKKSSNKKVITGVILAMLLVGIGLGAYGVTQILLGSSDSADNKTAEINRTAERDDDADTEEVEKKRDKKAADDKEQTSVAESSVSKIEDSEESEKTEKDSENESEKESDKEAVAFTPSEEEIESKATAENTSEKDSAKKEAGDTKASENKTSEKEAVAYTPEPDSSSSANGSSDNNSSDYGIYKLANTDYLTLRSSATMNNKNNKIVKIPANSEVKVLGIGYNGYWKVNYNGQEGYVLPSYLTVTANSKSIKKQYDYKIITDYVTLRDIPSTDGEDWGKITTGEVVEFFDTADNNYLLVAYNGRMGYIMKTYNGETLVEKVK